MNKKFTSLPKISLLVCLLLVPFFSSIGQTSKPVATIISPSNGSNYYAGQTIQLSGTGTDVKDGNLPDEAFEWYIQIIHGEDINQHVHDGAGSVFGSKTGSFTTSLSDDHNLYADIFIRILLVVSNSQNIKDTAITEIIPLKSNVSFQSIPTGIPVGIFGNSPVEAPFTATSVEKSFFQFSIPNEYYDPISKDTFVFDKLSNGSKNSAQAFTVPANDTSITIYYKRKVTSIEKENILRDKVKVFPVPANNFLNIHYLNLLPSPVLIEISDLSGRKLKESPIPFNTNNLNVDLSNLDKGMYYLNIICEEVNVTKKIIKE